MCFRPAEINEAQVCPECGKKLRVINGIKQTSCPFCKAELSDADTVSGDMPAPSSPQAPSAPFAPKAPAPPRG